MHCWRVLAYVKPSFQHCEKICLSFEPSALLNNAIIAKNYSVTPNEDLSKDLIKTVAHPTLSYATSLSEFHLSNDTTKDLLTKKALNCPSKLAYAFPHQGVNLTFGELKARVAIAAKNFQGKQNIEIN